MRTLLVVIASSVLAAPVVAQEVYKNVEYIAGKDGFEKKQKGHLIVTEDSVSFATIKDETIFLLPVRAIKDATNNVDIRGASVGKKMLFGLLAGDRKQDFVTINVETDSSAEAVTFKVKQHTGASIVAKINFQVKRLRGDTPEPAPGEVPADTLTASNY